MSLAKARSDEEGEIQPDLELRQLHYFVRIVELGSIGRAATELGIATSHLSQQISRLEAQLSTRLLRRSRGGVVPTDSGFAFLRHAQLAVRYAADAIHAAKQQRLTGHVSVGLAPTTAAILGVPLLKALRDRHPEVRLHLVTALSGHLRKMLEAQQLDLAVVFRTESTGRFIARPLLEEQLYLIAHSDLPDLPSGESVELSQIGEIPLVLPSVSHGLRTLIDMSFERARVRPRIEYEIDGLGLLMRAVRDGIGATLQPGSMRHAATDPLRALRVADADVRRQSLVASATEDLSAAALATREVIAEVAQRLVADGHWPGATLHPWNLENNQR
jgi:LysR family tcuABC transcriptional regulator